MCCHVPIIAIKPRTGNVVVPPRTRNHKKAKTQERGSTQASSNTGKTKKGNATGFPLWSVVESISKIHSPSLPPYRENRRLRTIRFPQCFSSKRRGSCVDWFNHAFAIYFSFNKKAFLSTPQSHHSLCMCSPIYYITCNKECDEFAGEFKYMHFSFDPYRLKNKAQFSRILYNRN